MIAPCLARLARARPLRRRLASDERGAAFLEGAIVLPVFIACFAAVLHFHGVFSAQLHANVRARRCAWRDAVSGCSKSARVLGQPSSAGQEDRQGLLRRIRSDGLEGANRLALALIGMSEGIVAEPRVQVRRPSLFGGGTATVRARVSLLCNEEDMDVIDLAMASYCALGKNHFLGCPAD